jgi:hypothetical protein
LAEAQAMFDYAQQRSWTGVRHSRPLSPSDAPLDVPAVPALPVPLDSDAVLHNPLHGSAASAPSWHVVYAGITPGIYAS